MKDSSGFNEFHKVKLSLFLHQVKLTVKFQCQIVLVIKDSSNQIISQTTPKPLILGKSQIGQSLQIDWECQYNTSLGIYFKMQISVLVKNLTGVIHAGLCNVDVTRQSKKAVFPLKKCSDKSATITVTCVMEFLKTLGSNKSYRVLTNSQSKQFIQAFDNKLSRMKSETLFRNSNINQTSLSASKISLFSNNRNVESLLKSQNDKILEQNEKLRQKLRDYERKDNRMRQQLISSEKQKQKLKIKYSEIQGLNELNEMLLVQKQKSMKSFELQISRLEQKIGDYLEQINDLQQKIDLKDQHLMNATEKANGKIAKIEEELSKTTNAHMALLIKYQESQKSLTEIMREKQKKSCLQKSKLNKQIKQLQEVVDSLKEDKVKNVKIIQELQNKIKLFNNSQNEQLRRLLSEKQKTIQSLKEQLKNANSKNVQISEQFQQLKSNQQGKLKLKKKLSELKSENSSIRIQIQRKNQMIELFQSKNQELTIQKMEIEKSKSVVQNVLDELQSQLICKKKQSNQIEHQKELSKRIADELAYKLQNVQETQREMRKVLEQKVEITKKQNDYLFGQINRISKQLEVLKEEFEKLQIVVQNKEVEIAGKQKQLIKVKQISMTKQSELIIVEQHNKYIMIQLQQNKQMVQESYLSVKELQLKLEEAILNISNNQIQLKEKFLQVQDFKKQNQSHFILQKQLYEKIGQLQAKLILQKESFKQLQCEIVELRRDKKYLQSKNLKYQQNLFQLQNNLSNEKQEKKSIGTNLKELSEKYIKISSDFQEYIIFQEQTKQDLQSKQKQMLEFQKQFQEYKLQTYEAGFQIFGKLQDEDKLEQQIKYLFPDERLKQKQVYVITKRIDILKKQRRYFDSLNEQKQFLVGEIQKLGQKLNESEIFFEQQLEKAKEDKFVLEQQYFNERGKFIKKAQELTVQNDKLSQKNDVYFKENKLLSLKIEQLQKDLLKLNDEHHDIEQKFVTEQQNRAQLINNFVQQLRQSRNQLSDHDEQWVRKLESEQQKIQMQIQAFRSNLARREQDLRRKNQGLQERLRLIQKQNKKMSFELSVQVHLNQDNQKQLNQAVQRNKNQKQIIKSLHDEIFNKNEQMSRLQQALSDQSIKQLEYSEKLQILSENKEINERLIIELKQGIEMKSDVIEQWKAKLKLQEDQHNREMKINIEQLNKAIQDVSIYRVMVQQAQGIVENLQREKDKLQQQLLKFQKQGNTFQFSPQRLEKSLQFQEKCFNKLLDTYQQQTKKYNQAKIQLGFLRQSNQFVKSQLQAKIEQVKSKQKFIEQMLQLQQRFKDKVECTNKIYFDEIYDLKLLLRQQNLVFNQIQQLKSACQVKDSTIQELLKQKQRIVNDYELQIVRLTSTLQRFQQKNEVQFSQLRKQRDHLLKQIESLTNEQSQHNTSLVIKDGQKTQSKAIIEEMKNKIDVLQTEINSFNNQKQQELNEYIENKIVKSLNEMETSDLLRSAEQQLLRQNQQQCKLNQILDDINYLKQKVARSKQCISVFSQNEQR